MGAAVDGLDLTEAAVERLAACVPRSWTFVRADIGAPGLASRLGASTADAVSRWTCCSTSSMTTCSSRPCGTSTTYSGQVAICSYSDLFVHGPRQSVPHRVSRPLADVERLMERRRIRDCRAKTALRAHERSARHTKPALQDRLVRPRGPRAARRTRSAASSRSGSTLGTEAHGAASREPVHRADGLPSSLRSALRRRSGGDRDVTTSSKSCELRSNLGQA